MSHIKIKLIHKKETCALSIRRHKINIRLTESYNTSIGVNLKVTPDIVWLTEDNGYSDYFEVLSNTNWQVYKEE